MDQYIFTLTIVTLVLISIIALALIYIVYQLIKLKNIQNSPLQVRERVNIVQDIENVEPSEEVYSEPKVELNCIHHPKIPAVGSCSICENTFCSICLKNHKSLQLCKDHLELFLSNDWGEITTVHTNPNEPEKGIFLYDFKKAVWDSDQIPTYIQTQYKINLESDEIESFVALYGRVKDIPELKEQVEQLH
jgi:hypothetical protein